MRKETTCSREACWYHSLTAKRTGISSCISAPTTKVALELCLWRTMPLSWLAPKATIIPAESQSLPSDVHSYLHGLSVDKNQLAPQVTLLHRLWADLCPLWLSNPSCSYLCINLVWPWDGNGRSLQNSWATQWEGQQRPQGETAL